MLDKTDVNVCARFSGRFVEVDEMNFSERTFDVFAVENNFNGSESKLTWSKRYSYREYL